MSGGKLVLTGNFWAGLAAGLVTVLLYKHLTAPKEKAGTWDADGRLVPKDEST